MKALCGVAILLAASAALWLGSFLAAGGEPTSSPGEGDVVRPAAKVQTDPVAHGGDAADDPAIWVHPTDPARSLILGTDKVGGLYVYDMAGRQRQLVSDACRPNNVDVVCGFRLGGKAVDLALASCRPAAAPGVKVWLIDPDAGKLSDVTAGGTISVFGGRTPYGLCTYRSAKTGKCYFFVAGKSGAIEQHVLRDAGGGRVKAALVRNLKLKSVTEGCVADDELGCVYFAEENAGIWKFPAEPDAGGEGRLVAKVGQHALTADVEGLTIYTAAGGKGYLIASSQGSNTFKVYQRQGDNRYVLTIDPRAGRIDGVSDTDGIAVTNRPTSTQFPAGVLVVQDGHNSGGNQNFKLYDWRDIAGTRLLVDPKFRPPGP